MSLKDYDHLYNEANPDDAGGGDFFQPELGEHVCQIMAAKWDTSKKDQAQMLVVEFGMLNGKDAGNTFRTFRKVSPKTMASLKRDLINLGLGNMPLSSITTGVHLAGLIGRKCKVEVTKNKSGGDPWKNIVGLCEPMNTQPPQQPARQADEYATDPSDFGAGSEDLPF